MKNYNEYKNIGGRYSCELCTKTLGTSNGIIKHIAEVHNTEADAKRRAEIDAKEERRQAERLALVEKEIAEGKRDERGTEIVKAQQNDWGFSVNEVVMEKKQDYFREGQDSIRFQSVKLSLGSSSSSRAEAFDLALKLMAIGTRDESYDLLKEMIDDRLYTLATGKEYVVTRIKENNSRYNGSKEMVEYAKRVVAKDPTDAIRLTSFRDDNKVVNVELFVPAVTK